VAGVEHSKRMGKAIVGGTRRAVLCERKNIPSAAVNAKEKYFPQNNLQSKCTAKQALNEKAKPKVGAVVPPVLAPEPPLPSMPEESADVSMKEEELCQAFSDARLTVEDIDEQDGDMPQLCSEYVKDIYAYLSTLEVQQSVQPKYLQGYEINERMRALLIDWLIQVHARFQLLQETLYLTVAVLDRFLQVQPVSRRKLQLAGVTAMLVASKYEEMYSPEVADFAYITDNAFTKAQILQMEQLILKCLNFAFGRPLPLHFLRRASKAANSNVEKHTLAKYLMELTLVDYDMVHYRPSEIAAASLCLSQLLLEDLPWSPTQHHYTMYDENHLKPIMQHLAKNVVTVNEGKTKFQLITGPDNARMGKATVGGARRAALGELTNVPGVAVNSKKALPSKGATKQALNQKAKPKVGAVVVPVLAPEPPLASMPEELADVSMKEEEELCQAFSDALLTVEDIDEQDGDMPQLCSEYVKDIYAYLSALEEQQSVRPKYLQGYEINERMRALLIDWLIQVHARFQLLQETLYLTVAVLDRFLQVQPVSRRKLQLAGVTAMLVASKYEEMYSPEVADFAYITDNAFTKAQILQMEQLILKSLKFNLGRPLPLHFLRRASKAANSNVEKHTLAKYLMELTLVDYDMVHYRPSEIAAASLCLAQLLLEDIPWSPTQHHYASYDENHLKPIMQHLAKNVVTVNEGKTKFLAVKNKYSSSKLMKISLIPQLKSSVLTCMAAPLINH
ncbi:hypothetical protein CRUP_034346, partial [Coryphaenoides rupestris]